MESIIRILLVIIFSYLIGSFPSAIFISKRFFGFDIRKKGSGNMGSTNAFRILGWKWGLVVQILDLLKGFLAVVVIATYLGEGVSFGGYNTFFEDITIVKLIAGVSAVSGHIWTVFAGFKGGKGINTAAGMLIGIAPVDVGIAIGIFVLALIFSGYVSLGSILGAVAFPSSLVVRYNCMGAEIPGYHILIYFSIILAVLLIFTHRQNIIRLIKGTENKFSKLQIIKFTKHN